MRARYGRVRACTHSRSRRSMPYAMRRKTACFPVVHVRSRSHSSSSSPFACPCHSAGVPFSCCVPLFSAFSSRFTSLQPSTICTHALAAYHPRERRRVAALPRARLCPGPPWMGSEPQGCSSRACQTSHWRTLRIPCRKEAEAPGSACWRLPSLVSALSSLAVARGAGPSARLPVVNDRAETRTRRFLCYDSPLPSGRCRQECAANETPQTDGS